MQWGSTLYRASCKIYGKKIHCRGRGTGKVCLYRVVFFANYNMKKKNGNKIFLASFVILYYHYYYFFHFCLSLLSLLLLFFAVGGDKIKTARPHRDPVKHLFLVQERLCIFIWRSFPQRSLKVKMAW